MTGSINSWSHTPQQMEARRLQTAVLLDQFAAYLRQSLRPEVQMFLADRVVRAGRDLYADARIARPLGLKAPWYEAAIQLIVVYVAAQYGYTASDITGRNQNRELTWVRQTTAWLCYRLVHISYSALGKELCRDHATIMHSVRRTEQRRAASDEERSVIDELLEEVRYLLADYYASQDEFTAELR